VGSVTANWLLVRAFRGSRRRGLLAAGVVLNLALISIFKYADFLAGSVLAVLGETHERFNVVLPLGISFFTFQQISYLVDVRRGTAGPYPFRDYFLYVTYFPQLIAGPIVRHDEIIDQFALDPRRPGLWERLSRGSFLFVVGLAKKVVLADTIATIVDPLFASVQAGAALGALDAWRGAVGFALQVYFDFSGYSDMAIGLGLMCGFRLPLNFNAPFRATSIREFWRRWHMTLSRFLRDYLYIPLGGGRRGGLRQAMALTVTMLLGGLWHGADWTYVAFGACHGVYLTAEAAWARVRLELPRILGWALAMTAFVISLGVFRSESFGAIGSQLSAMAGANGLGAWGGGPDWALAVGAVAAVVGPTSQDVAFKWLRPWWVVDLVVAAALVVLLLLIVSETHVEFIYFQF
jgi:D-alanyl-lipoteichoic acid acyltransferase DltB (MBOAT superfamily)